MQDRDEACRRPPSGAFPPALRIAAAPPVAGEAGIEDHADQSTNSMPFCAARIGRSECQGLRPASGLASRK